MMWSSRAAPEVTDLHGDSFRGAKSSAEHQLNKVKGEPALKTCTQSNRSPPEIVIMTRNQSKDTTWERDECKVVGNKGRQW